MDRSGLSAAKSGLLGEFSAERAVALGIHWQRGVTSPKDGFGSVFAPAVAASGVLHRVNRVFQATRDAGGQVAHFAVCNADDVIVNCAIFSHAKESGALRCGTEAVEVAPEVGPADGDWSMEHHRGSVFFDTDVADRMKSRGANIVVVTGLATNVAVESSVRDACDRGYYIIVLSDACLAAKPERHDAAMVNMEVFATEVMTSDEYIRLLGEAGGESPEL